MNQQMRISLVALLPLSLAQPEHLCPICADGSPPINLSNEPFVPFGDFSCMSLLMSSQTIEGDTLGCDVLQLAAFQGSCCATANADDCPLCPNNGMVVDQMKEVPFPANDNLNCNALLNNATIRLDFLKQFASTPGACDDTILRRSAAWCGCEGVNLECTLCNGDPILDRRHPLTEVSCNELSYELAMLRADQCPDAAIRVGFDPAALCCPNNNSPPNICDVCSSEQSFVFDRVINTELYGRIACTDVQEAASLIASDQVCQVFRQDLASMCCVDLAQPTQPAECELTCPNGLPPPDLFELDPVTGYSCEILAMEYNKLTKEQCPNAPSILGFDSVAFCCPGVPAPRDCGICQVGQEFTFPHRVLFAYNEHTCNALQNSLAYAVGVGCHTVLDQSRALRNCPCRGQVTSTPAPEAPGFIDNGARGGISGGDLKGLGFALYLAMGTLWSIM